MSQYRRHYQLGGTYFFTVNLQDRSKHWLVEYIDLLRESVAFTKDKQPFHIDAWVVLPDHMHAMWTLPADESDYSSRWRDIKKRFTKSLAANTCFSAKTTPVWQKRFWEHTIRNETDFQKHFDYIHINPLKHGYVSAVKDWPYSSFHRAVRQGIYSRDWAGDLTIHAVNAYE